MVVATRDHVKSWVIPKFDHRDASLVLYLPLWYQYSDMTKSTIYSYDRNRHTGTVTGATWGKQGRTFAGGDDFIDIGDPDALVTQSAGTVWAWVKPTTLSALSTVFGYGGANVASPGALHLEFRAVAATYYLTATHVLEAGAGTDVIRGNTAISINNWYFCLISSDGTAYKFYVNDVLQTLTATAGTNAGDWFADALIPDSASRRILIGAAQHDGGTINYTTGIIGEVGEHDRQLTVAEGTHIYLATKWRYS